jgi:hypothetical protein
MKCLAKQVITRTSLGLLIIGLAFHASLATDPPDSKLNPMSGLIETTDSVWQVDNHNVRHVINLGGGYKTRTHMVTLGPLNDHGPRLAIEDDGDSFVVWWREGEVDQVMLRIRSYADDVWSTEKLVSESDENSRNPEITYDGANPWIVHEFDDTEGRSVSVRAINDGPNPFGIRAIVSTTDYPGDLDTMIHAESGHLWVSWIDSTTEVGWSEYDYGSESWGVESYEWYADDSVESARARIRSAVMNQ